MKLTIIGASGHGKVVADIAEKCGYDRIEFLDDNENIKSCGKWRVVGTTRDAVSVDNDIFIAIGNPSVRRRIAESIGDKSFPTLVHPDAVIGTGASLGKGTVVMAGAVVNPYSTVGYQCIINTCSSVDHDCVIGNYVHVAVGAHVCGTVNIGDNTWVGAGATVGNNVSICGDCIIGAGAVLVRNTSEPGTYVGVPAKMRKG